MIREVSKGTNKMESRLWCRLHMAASRVKSQQQVKLMSTETLFLRDASETVFM